MFVHQVNHIVSELLSPLIDPSGTLTSFQSHGLCELRTKLSRSTLLRLAEGEPEADHRMETIFTVTAAFKIECRCGGCLMHSAGQLIDHIRPRILEIGSIKVGTAARRKPQVVNQVIYADGLLLKMACALTRAIGWPLQLVAPEGNDVPTILFLNVSPSLRRVRVPKTERSPGTNMIAGQ